MKISVVIPVYACSKSLGELYTRLCETLRKITKDFEIIMVDDFSIDNSWKIISDIAFEDDRVKGIKFSKNFGQHYAIAAGLSYAQGDWVIVMDCDLQDQPEEILKLYMKAQEGYDIVFARREMREDKFLKKLLAKMFYRIYGYFLGEKIDHTIANFSIISKKVLHVMQKYKERHRSYVPFVNSIGFRKTSIEVVHARRKFGRSSYTFSKSMNFALDSIFSQSNKPLKFSIKFGFILAFLSFFYGLFIFYKYFFVGIAVQGWTTLIVIVSFLGGVLFINLGIIGLYLGKVFDELKERPIFIVDRKSWEDRK